MDKKIKKTQRDDLGDVRDKERLSPSRRKRLRLKEHPVVSLSLSLSHEISYIYALETATTTRSRSPFHIMLNCGGYIRVSTRRDAMRRACDAQRRVSYSSRGYAIQRISTADV